MHKLDNLNVILFTVKNIDVTVNRGSKHSSVSIQVGKHINEPGSYMLNVVVI